MSEITPARRSTRPSQRAADVVPRPRAPLTSSSVGALQSPSSSAARSQRDRRAPRQEAAQIIAEAIERKRGVITFPKPMAVLGHLLDAMPEAIYEPAARRGRKRHG